MSLVVRTELPPVGVEDERGHQIGTGIVEDGIAAIVISDEILANVILEIPTRSICECDNCGYKTERYFNACPTCLTLRWSYQW